MSASTEEEGPILFYGTAGEYGEFSNWFPAEFVYDGLRWANTEQAFMYYKSEEKEYRKAVRKATDPREAKKLGRNCKLRPDWDNVKYSIMLAVNMAKYQQNPYLAELLQSTGKRRIHENCKDPWWGGGPNFPHGKNWLGQVLEDVRTLLSNEEHKQE